MGLALQEEPDHRGSDHEVEVPVSVVVPAGADSATFAVTHPAVTKRTRIAVYAKDDNQTPAIVKRASLWVRPAH
jgi:hypothetical protein